MPRNRIKLFFIAALWLTCIAIVLGLKSGTPAVGVENAVQKFRINASAFSKSCERLQQAVSSIRPHDSASVLSARMALKDTRLTYKRIAFFMEYFFESSSMVYNRPAKIEVDEPYMEYQDPAGLQVMEAMLFDDEPYTSKTALLEQAELLTSSAADIPALLYGLEADDTQIMESLRLELVRVITLNITGYDAPELKSGILESQQSLEVIAEILKPYLQAYVSQVGLQTQKGQLHLADTLEINHELQQAIAYVRANTDFDSFDRMLFLQKHALVLQKQLNHLIAGLGLEMNATSALNYQADHLFSKGAVDRKSFGVSTITNDSKLELGRKLFFDKTLSGNQKRSCATCHKPELYFTDGLKTSLAFDEKASVRRNAPGLFYSGMQYAQFWDGRARRMQDQIGEVIANPLEMNGNHKVVLSRIRANADYLRSFALAFPDEGSNDTTLITMETLSGALSAYIFDLSPFNSPFDNHINGKSRSMTISQIKGFNLFMGKAQCATCHFAPLFNGLIPPFYKRTEFENIGTPANSDLMHPIADLDQGRYEFFPIQYYKKAFKTPSLRNVEKTGPYMHNGAYADLTSVVSFYNKGGGTGIGLHEPFQTMSPKPLHLTDEEVTQIVTFLQSLTDTL